MVSETPTEGRCNGESRQKDGYCEKYPTLDDDGNVRNGRCRFHGGTLPGAKKGNTYGVKTAQKSEGLTHFKRLEDDALLDAGQLIAAYHKQYAKFNDIPVRDVETHIVETRDLDSLDAVKDEFRRIAGVEHLRDYTGIRAKHYAEDDDMTMLGNCMAARVAHDRKQRKAKEKLGLTQDQLIESAEENYPEEAKHIEAELTA